MVCAATLNRYLYLGMALAATIAPARGSILEKPVLLDIPAGATYQQTLHALQRANRDLVLCVELPWTGEHGVTEEALTGATMTTGEALDFVCENFWKGVEYEWRSSGLADGVVHILPRDPAHRHPCLDRIIQQVEIDAPSQWSALMALFETPELQEIEAGCLGKGAAYPLQVTIRGLSVRDALTRIVLAAEHGIGWSIGGASTKRPMFSFGRHAAYLAPADTAVDTTNATAGDEWAVLKQQASPEALELFHEAQAREGEHRTREAVALYKMAAGLSTAPETRAALLFRVADIHHYIANADWTPDTAEARILYRQIVEEFPGDFPEVIRSRKWLGVLAAQAGDEVTAREQYRALLALRAKLEEEPAAARPLALEWVQYVTGDVRQRLESLARR